MSLRPVLSAAVAAALLAGCGDPGGAADRETGAPPLGARPVGPGARYRPAPATRRVPGCRRGALGPRTGVHLELFGDGLVVILPAGLGTRPPRSRFAGRISAASCFGPVVSIDATGLMLLRPGARATVGDVFALWGQPLAPARAASFRGRVRAYVNGRRLPGDPRSIPLRRHDEVVLEVGAHVPPHARYTFPAGY